MFSAGSVSLLGTVMLSEGVDTSLSSHVELISAGSSSNVNPIGVVRSEILEATGFVIVSPLEIKYNY